MFEFFKNFYQRNLSRPEAAILILQFVTIFIIIYFFSSIFGPLLAALVLAFMLERPVSFLVKHGTSRLNATILVTLLYLAIVASIVLAVIPPAVAQLSKIAQNISTAINNEYDNKNVISLSEDSTILVPPTNAQEPLVNKEMANIKDMPNDAPLDTKVYDASVSTLPIEDSNKEIPTQPLSPENKIETDVAINWIMQNINKVKEKLPSAYHNLITQEQLHEFVKYSKGQIKNWISPILTTQLAPFIMDTMTALMYLIIVPIFSFYMLKDKVKLLKTTGHYFSNYNSVTIFWQEINKQVSQYLNGKCIHVLIISFINGLAFWLYGLNYALILGIGVGLSVIIPYVGAVIISVPFLIIAFLQYGLSTDCMWIIGIYLVIQLIDSYVITPMLFSETLNLDAFSILVAIIVFGGIWGFWGVVLAIPLATFVKTIVNLWPTTVSNVKELTKE